MKSTADLSGSFGPFKALFSDQTDCIPEMDSHIKKIWASPPSAPPSPSSVMILTSADDAEDSKTLDEALGLSSVEGPDVDAPGFIEAVQLMRPHERFIMAKLTGTIGTGIAYYPCPKAKSNANIWDRRRFGMNRQETTTLTEDKPNIMEDTEDELFLRSAHLTMLEWVSSDDFGTE